MFVAAEKTRVPGPPILEILFKAPPPMAVKAEVTQEAAALPVFPFPALDNLLAVSNKVGGPANAFLVQTQQQIQPQYFYLTK